MYLVKLLLFILTSFSHDVLSQHTRFNTSIIPITKDANTSLHKVSLGLWEGKLYYLIDLDAPFTWRDCVVHTPEIPCGYEECQLPLPCSDTLCKEARSYLNPICPSLNITAKYGCKICAVTPMNPISKTCKLSQLSVDMLDMYWTDGRNPSTGVFTTFEMKFVISCAPSSLLRSLPKDVRGFAAFSWSTSAIPRQIAYAISYRDIADKFALCLPSSSLAPGVAFTGDGPFYFLPSKNLDIRSILSYTPMIRKDSKSLGYYIEINQISIKGTPLPLPLLKTGSVKLSSVVPYTSLRSDIYKALVSSFSKATKNIPRVNVVKPFSLCMKANAIGSVSSGFRVPNIDLVTESGKIWTISGDNSMKRIGNGAACLAFIDGGSGVKDAIVIGTFQMENNFLFFDLVNQRLGFSSSLLSRGTSCSNFNFTQISE